MHTSTTSFNKTAILRFAQARMCNTKAMLELGEYLDNHPILSKEERRDQLVRTLATYSNSEKDKQPGMISIDQAIGNSYMNNEQRVIYAENLLHITLTQEQKQVLIEAHELFEHKEFWEITPKERQLIKDKLGDRFTTTQKELLIYHIVCGGNRLKSCLILILLLLGIGLFLKEFGVFTETTSIEKDDGKNYPTQIVVRDGKYAIHDTTTTKIVGITAQQSIVDGESEYTLGYDLGEGKTNIEYTLNQSHNSFVIDNLSFPDTIRWAFSVSGPYDLPVDIPAVPGFAEQTVKDMLTDSGHKEKTTQSLNNMTNKGSERSYRALIETLKKSKKIREDTACKVALAFGGVVTSAQEGTITFKDGISIKVVKEGLVRKVADKEHSNNPIKN